MTSVGRGYQMCQNPRFAHAIDRACAHVMHLLCSVYLCSTRSTFTSIFVVCLIALQGGKAVARLKFLGLPKPDVIRQVSARLFIYSPRSKRQRHHHDL